QERAAPALERHPQLEALGHQRLRVDDDRGRQIALFPYDGAASGRPAPPEGACMSPSRRWFTCAVPALILAAAAAAAAQPTATYKTGADYYLAYRAAFMKAKSVDELAPWMSKQRRDQIAKETPA